MDKTTTDIIVNKLGTMQFANAELAAQNIDLSRKLAEALSENKRLQDQLAALKVTPLSNLPANPYGEGDEANGAGVH